MKPNNDIRTGGDGRECRLQCGDVTAKSDACDLATHDSHAVLGERASLIRANLK